MHKRPQFFARIASLAFLLALLIMPAASAFAQNSSLSQAVSLSKSAMEDYDFLELESADAKLIQAVQIIENIGVTDPGVANIYMAQGIVSYGRFKDSALTIAEERAFSAFIKALTLNADVTIPNDYKSPEIEAIFLKAQSTLQDPGPVKLQLPEVKPSIQHTPLAESNRCHAIEIQANVPAHPDVYRVYLHYAPDDQRGYTTVEMKPSYEASDYLSATIPSLETQGDKIQYYLEAQNRAGETVANVATATLPYTVTMSGKCTGLTADDIASTYGDPLFQLSILLGTGLGIVEGETVNCWRSDNCKTANGNHVSTPTSVNTGMASMPLHLRASAMFNLPKDFQIGLYVRGQLINIVSKTLAAPDKLDNPEIYNIMIGLALRYLAISKQPYRLYVGVEVGWGGANASVPLGANYNNFVDLYLYEGPIHIAPEVGFLWTFHKNMGLAIELAVPIHFPDKPSAHFDLSVGPYFQF